MKICSTRVHLVITYLIAGFQAFYKASKLRFDSDPAFKEKAQLAVVSLQVKKNESLSCLNNPQEVL